MSFITEYFISGKSFFTGNILLILAVLCSFSYKKPLFKAIVRIFLIFGLLLIIFSSTHIDTFMYSLTGLLVFALFFALQLDAQKMAFTHACRAGVAICCLVAISKEMKFWRMPARHEKIYVLGDSISAGIGFKGEKIWTNILKDKYGVEILNYSVPGGTVESAIERTGVIYEKNILVIIELGGNDVSRKVPLKDFKKNLKALLKELAQPGRTVVMFETPCPPTQGIYGDIQRQLARQYGVSLIPKRVFASIICGRRNTMDGLHLSNEGHEKMAGFIWDLIKDCIAKKPKKSKTKASQPSESSLQNRL